MDGEEGKEGRNGKLIVFFLSFVQSVRLVCKAQTS